MQSNPDRLLDAAEILIDQGLRVEALPVLQLVSDGGPSPEQRARILELVRLALDRRPPARDRLKDLQDLPVM